MIIFLFGKIKKIIKISNFFNPKLIYRDKINLNKNGGILIVSRARRHECEFYNTGQDYDLLIYSYVNLIKKISKNVTTDITFRFRNFKSHYFEEEKKNFGKKIFLLLNLTMETKKLKKSLKNYRLCLLIITLLGSWRIYLTVFHQYLIGQIFMFTYPQHIKRL